MKTELKISIKVLNIEVDENIYSFDWKAAVGPKNYKGTFNSDYENGMTKEEWRAYLEDGYAVECALEDLMGNFSITWHV